MKKVLFLMTGLVISLFMMAQGSYTPPQVEHTMTLECNPYTCHSATSVTLQSTLNGGNPGYADFWQYDAYDDVRGLSHLTEDHNAKTFDVSPYVGKSIYIVPAKTYTFINAPAHRAPARLEEDFPQSLMPTPWWSNYVEHVDQYDVYRITVKYHVENHTVTIPADMFTNTADFQLYTSAGQEDPNNPGKIFCGLDLKYKVNKGTSEDVDGAIIIESDASKVNDVVTLPIGTHVYSVYMVDRYGRITFCDRFTINVTAPSCTSGLVYSKWDDFLFVDNGAGGGNGTFVSYQWYNSGKAIDGATLQWMRTEKYEGGKPSGQYYVKITDKAGNIIITCPKYFNEFPRSEESNHHSAAAPARKQLENGQLIIEYNGSWYNAQGVKVK